MSHFRNRINGFVPLLCPPLALTRIMVSFYLSRWPFADAMKHRFFFADRKPFLQHVCFDVFPKELAAAQLSCVLQKSMWYCIYLTVFLTLALCRSVLILRSLLLKKKEKLSLDNTDVCNLSHVMESRSKFRFHIHIRTVPQKCTRGWMHNLHFLLFEHQKQQIAYWFFSGRSR